MARRASTATLIANFIVSDEDWMTRVLGSVHSKKVSFQVPVVAGVR